MREEIRELESQTSQADFWDDRVNAGKVLFELKKRKRRLDPWDELLNKYQDLSELYELALQEQDQSLEKEIERSLQELEAVHQTVNG